MRYINEDFLDDISQELQRQTKAQQLVGDSEYADTDKAAYDYELRVQFELYGIDFNHNQEDAPENIFQTEHIIDEMRHIMDHNQVMERFFVGEIDLRETNDFHNEFFTGHLDYPFDSELNLVTYYNQHPDPKHKYGTYHAMPKLTFHVWFDKCDSISRNRFDNQMWTMSQAFYTCFNRISCAKSNTISFSVFELKDGQADKYSISSFEFYAGKTGASSKALTRLYHKMYGGDDLTFGDGSSDYDSLGRKLLRNFNIHRYMDEMEKTGGRYGLTVKWRDVTEQHITTSREEYLRSYGRPNTFYKILSCDIEPRQGKEVDLSVVEETIVGGFIQKMPYYVTTLLQFYFIVRIQAKLVNDS